MNGIRLSEVPRARPACENLLAEVVSVEGVGGTGRIDVRLLSYDGPENQDGLIRARVCVPVSGGGRGTFLIPEVGDEVLVSFINGDPRQAVVIGSLWNGTQRPSEQLGGDGRHVDRWTFVGKKGTRIAIVEETSGSSIRLSVSDSLYIEISETAGGKIELKAGSSTLSIDQTGISLETSGTAKTQASTTEVTSAVVNVNAGMATFSGVVQSQVVTTTSVISSSYTPGAGNVW
jgi:uncharacterized protein involved in type VI secretion and phage assembly